MESWRPWEDALSGQLSNAIGKSAPMTPHHGRQRESIGSGLRQCLVELESSLLRHRTIYVTS